jgi:hypothetical protein
LTLGANRGGNGIASKRQSTGASSSVGVSNCLRGSGLVLARVIGARSGPAPRGGATWAFAAAGTQKKTIPHSNNELYKFFMSSPFLKVLLCISYSFITYTSRFMGGGFVFFRKVNKKVST